VTIKPKDVILPFVILFALNVTLLSLWTAIAPWKWQRKNGAGRDQFGRETDTYGTCESVNHSLTRLFGFLLGAVNVIPLVLANYQSYRCWNLPTEYNESRYLAISMASLLEASLIGLPFILIAVNPTAVFLSRATILSVACMALLLPMFVPKWLNRKNPGQPTRKVSIVRASISNSYSNSNQ